MRIINFNYNNDFRVTLSSVSGTNVSFTYDNDGLIKTAGGQTLNYSAQNTLLLNTTLGSVADSYTYNSFAELLTYASAYSGSSLFSMSVARDALGRITAKTESFFGFSDNYTYTYDVSGRLTRATRNGIANTYTYDQNGNRTGETKNNIGTNATYDSQDRLLTYGSTTYTYTANGELKSKTASGQTTTYTYDVLGNLKQVSLPNGNVIEYIIDGLNRRVGKKMNGVLIRMYVYQSQTQLAAELDGTGSLIARYVYTSKTNTPDQMITPSGTFRILSDHIGSPRMIINTATGNVIQQTSYDEFGISSNTTLVISIGFAAGLYDPDTRLVRFGARDYDPEVGRWTSKDPILFSGRQTNLYGYVFNDPINLIDPNGMCGPLCTGGIGALIGGIIGGITAYATNESVTEGIAVGAITGFAAGFGASIFQAAASAAGASTAGIATSASVGGAISGFTANLAAQLGITGNVNTNQAVAVLGLGTITPAASVFAGGGFAAELGIGLSASPFDLGLGIATSKNQCGGR